MSCGDGVRGRGLDACMLVEMLANWSFQGQVLGASSVRELRGERAEPRAEGWADRETADPDRRRLGSG